MSETFFISDTHINHANSIIHGKRPYLLEGDLNEKGKWISEEVKQARTDEMNRDIVRIWNGIVGPKDLIYICGDFCWRDHRKWLNELHGKKVLIIGNHDRMPQDALDLFLGNVEWNKLGYEESVKSMLKTMTNFREVHQLLDRKICGQRMTLCHYPMNTWSSSIHGSWEICGHSHGRHRDSRPGEADGGLILDVGWDIWHKPLSFEEVKAEMRIKFNKMPQNFKDHVMKGMPLSRDEEDLED